MVGLSFYVFSGLLLGSVLAFLVFFSQISLWDFLVFSRSISGRVWVSPFECGCLSVGYFSSYLGFGFVCLLVFFVVFDLEVVLLLNIPFGFSYFSNFFYYLLFLFILSVGYSLEVKGGYVSWCA